MWGGGGVRSLKLLIYLLKWSPGLVQYLEASNTLNRISCLVLLCCHMVFHWVSFHHTLQPLAGRLGEIFSSHTPYKTCLSFVLLYHILEFFCHLELCWDKEQSGCPVLLVPTPSSHILDRILHCLAVWIHTHKALWMILPTKQTQFMCYCRY